MSINDETLRLGRKLRITLDQTTNAAVRTLTKAWVQAWDAIHDEWADAAMDLATEAHDNDGWPSQATVLRHDRAARALLAANEQIALLAEESGVTVRDAVGRLVEDTPGWQYQIIASQYPPTLDRATLTAGFNRVDDVALQVIVERTTERITAGTLRLSQVGQYEMRRALVQGIALGANPRDTARRMVRRAEGAFNGGLTRALTIARTETLDAYRASAAEAQLANRDVLAGWTWLSQLDTRTCGSCWGMHGTEHALTEDGPNDHHQGRCARMPQTKTWAELGFTGIDEPASLVPDATARFDALTPEEQLGVLGAGRLLAYRQGAPLSDMASLKINPGWRPSYVPTSPEYLLRRYAA